MSSRIKELEAQIAVNRKALKRLERQLALDATAAHLRERINGSLTAPREPGLKQRLQELEAKLAELKRGIK